MDFICPVLRISAGVSLKTCYRLRRNLDISLNQVRIPLLHEIWLGWERRRMAFVGGIAKSMLSISGASKLSRPSNGPDARSLGNAPLRPRLLSTDRWTDRDNTTGIRQRVNVTAPQGTFMPRSPSCRLSWRLRCAGGPAAGAGRLGFGPVGALSPDPANCRSRAEKVASTKP